jgi:hypothetical protein
MNARELVERMVTAEERFLERTFMAPVLPGARVRVRLEGIVWEFAVTPRQPVGWAVLRPIDRRTAQVTGVPPLGKVREYLGLFPTASLVAAEQRGGVWWALPADGGAARLRGPGLAPVPLAKQVQLFDTVRARWDGVRFLFEGKSARRDPSVGAYLRAALADGTPAAALERRTLTREERAAYSWQLRLAEEKRELTVEDRLRAAVAHAGGKLLSHVERDFAYTVTYDVDGETHVSTVQKDDFTVVCAGICLDEQDGKFDLASLVSVVREGQQSWD